MSHRLKLLIVGFFLFVDSGCGRAAPAAPEAPSPARVTADQIAIELGLPSDTTIQRVATADLAKYPLQLDVFRQSQTAPPLGAFRPEYTPLLVPASSLPESDRARIARRLFETMTRYEFSILSQNGKPFRVTLVSVGATAPDGIFRLDVVKRTTRLDAEDGPSVPVSIPFPWLRTDRIPEEPMTWGLWMGGGYFVQSTPFYADLGLPAVNGGVHQSLPDAMALYSLAQTMPAIVRIHAADSAEATARLHALAPMEWILPRIDDSRQQIAEVINLLGPEVRLLGHGWVDPISGDFLPASWPKCGVFDCFKSWKVERPAE